MAKLAGLMNKVAGLKEQLAICNNAYMDILKKYNKLYQKYSYQETIEKVKEISEKRQLEGKLLL